MQSLDVLTTILFLNPTSGCIAHRTFCSMYYLCTCNYATDIVLFLCPWVSMYVFLYWSELPSSHYFARFIYLAIRVQLWHQFQEAFYEPPDRSGDPHFGLTYAPPYYDNAFMLPPTMKLICYRSYFSSVMSFRVESDLSPIIET